MSNSIRTLKINEEYILMGTPVEGVKVGLSCHDYRWSLVHMQDTDLRKGSWLSLVNDEDQDASIQHILEEIEKGATYRTLNFQVQTKIMADIESSIREIDGTVGFSNNEGRTFSCAFILTENLVLALDRQDPDSNRFATQILHFDEAIADPNIHPFTDVKRARQGAYYLLNNFGINIDRFKDIFRKGIGEAIERFSDKYTIDQEAETKAAMISIDGYYDGVWENIILPIEGMVALSLSVDPEGSGVAVGLVGMKKPMDVVDLTTWFSEKEDTYFYPLGEEEKEKFMNTIEMSLDEPSIEALGVDNLIDKIKNVLTLYIQEGERRHGHN